MASAHQPTEVFKFLHVRNVKPIPIATDPLVYNEYILPAGANNLYTQLLVIKNNAAIDWKDKILLGVTNFKGSPDYFKNTFVLNKTITNFYAINDFLQNNNLPVGVTLRVWLNNTYLIDVNTFFTPAVNANIDRVWNNIFAQSISPDNNGVLDQATIHIQVAKLLKLTKDNNPAVNTIEGIRSILKATVLLPDTLFPINFFPSIPIPPVFGGNEGYDKTEVALYHKTKLAIKELDAWYDAELDKLKRTLPVANFRVNEDGLIPSDVQAYIDALAVFNVKLKELNSYENLYKDAIGVNFKDVIFAIGETAILNKPKDEISDILFAQASMLFDKNSINPKKGYRTTGVGKSILEESAHDSCDCCKPSATNPTQGGDRFRVGPIGMGDFYKVEQQLECYKPAEIAHVENVMIGETRNRETRRLDRYEEISVTETESITESEKDLQTTSRSEQEVNSESVTEQNQSISGGINTSGFYGNVTFNTTFNASTSGFASSSEANASKYSRSITERARQLEIKRLRTEKTVKILREFEETNTHGFVNNTAVNQVGVYRWLDKFYYNRLVNYGPHLMFEFIIPEPAFFHVFAKKISQAANAAVALVKPLAPDDSSLAFPLNDDSNVDRNNYAFWAAYYGVDLDSPPDSQVVISQAYSGNTNSFNDLSIPDGYSAASFDHSGLAASFPGNTFQFWAKIGGNGIHGTYVSEGNTIASANSLTLYGEEGNIGVSFFAEHVLYFTFNIRIICQLKSDVFNAWKSKQYQKIWAAYNLKLKEYNDQLNSLQQQLSFSPSYGTNPAFYREIEKTELKKNCLEMMMDPRFTTFQEAVNCPNSDPCSQPELNKYVTNLNARTIKFFETAFEWSQITYEFYDYYWGRKCKWVELYNMAADDDQLFQKFLQAGAARVVVPVTPGREASIMYYIETGIMTEANISLTDPLNVAVATEIKDTKKYPIVTDTWTTKMPTNLVAMQCVSACIDNDILTGMPCYDKSTLDLEPPQKIQE
jgi:hypothetical protein